MTFPLSTTMPPADPAILPAPGQRLPGTDSPGSSHALPGGTDFLTIFTRSDSVTLPAAHAATATPPLPADAAPPPVAVARPVDAVPEVEPDSPPSPHRTEDTPPIPFWAHPREPQTTLATAPHPLIPEAAPKDGWHNENVTNIAENAEIPDPPPPIPPASRTDATDHPPHLPIPVRAGQPPLPDAAAPMATPLRETVPSPAARQPPSTSPTAVDLGAGPAPSATADPLPPAAPGDQRPLHPEHAPARPTAPLWPDPAAREAALIGPPQDLAVAPAPLSPSPAPQNDGINPPRALASPSVTNTPSAPPGPSFATTAEDGLPKNAAAPGPSPSRQAAAEPEPRTANALAQTGTLTSGPTMPPPKDGRSIGTDSPSREQPVATPSAQATDARAPLDARPANNRGHTAPVQPEQARTITAHAETRPAADGNGPSANPGPTTAPRDADHVPTSPGRSLDRPLASGPQHEARLTIAQAESGIPTSARIASKVATPSAAATAPMQATASAPRVSVDSAPPPASPQPTPPAIRPVASLRTEPPQDALPLPSSTPTVALLDPLPRTSSHPTSRDSAPSAAPRLDPPQVIDPLAPPKDANTPPDPPLRSLAISTAMPATSQPAAQLQRGDAVLLPVPSHAAPHPPALPQADFTAAERTAPPQGGSLFPQPSSTAAPATPWPQPLLAMAPPPHSGEVFSAPGGTATPSDSPTTVDRPTIAVTRPVDGRTQPQITGKPPLALAQPLSDVPLPLPARSDGSSGAPTPAQAPMQPLSPTPLPDLVSRHILPNLAAPGAVTVTLSPVDLGTLIFEVSPRGDGLHLHLTVDTPETLDLLRRQGDQILAELRQAGFGQASLSFASQDGQTGAESQNGAARQDRPSDPRPDPGTSPATTTPHLPRAAAPGTLDLRL